MKNAAAALASRKVRNGRSQSTKGSLIKGMIKKVPAIVLDDPYFEEAIQKYLKGYSGIYALYKREKLYYVGLTKNLKTRLAHHKKDRHKNKWNAFVVFRIGKVRFLKDIETLVLRIAKPPGNRTVGHVPRKGDLTKELRNIQRKQQRAMQKAAKAWKQ